MIGAAHLEGFGTIEDVARAKGEIAAGLPSTGTFYVNVDDERCRAIGRKFSGRRVRFGSAANFETPPRDGDVAIENISFASDGSMILELAPIGRIRLPLRARAHATNVALAVAVGLQHDVTDFEVPLRIACASSSRFRTRTIESWTIIDDTYNANPASVEAALQTLGEWPTDGVRIAVLGAMLELGSESAQWHRRVGAAAAEYGIDALFARGPDAHAMVDAARQEGLEYAEVIDDHDGIAAAVRALATPGSVILCKGSRGMRMEKVVQSLAGDAVSAKAGSH
jgi:UDP-N-acetylmuramyl pentapeptide synthase